MHRAPAKGALDIKAVVLLTLLCMAWGFNAAVMKAGHAAGAHYFPTGDRISLNKAVGLLLAFLGIVILQSKHLGLPSLIGLAGDMLALAAAMLWAGTTIRIKRRLVGKVSPHHTLFYQTIFSIPMLFLLIPVHRQQAALTLKSSLCIIRQ